ncbi:MAG TPA: hypothetical protein EYQ14_25785 [Gammaproteobacteria bacterium]|nr:hypothetical protein [Gammaproteobacteria bacterium]
MKAFNAVKADTTKNSEADISWAVVKDYADPKGKLTQQQERFVFLVSSGVPAKAALAGAGYGKTVTPSSILRLEAVKKSLQFVKEQEANQIFVNRDKLTTMLFAAHAKSINATEEISAIRELGKLHDVYEQAKEDRKSTLHTAVQINHNNVAKLSDQELLKIAQMASTELAPQIAADNNHATNALDYLEENGMTVADGYSDIDEPLQTLPIIKGEYIEEGEGKEGA